MGPCLVLDTSQAHITGALYSEERGLLSEFSFQTSYAQSVTAQLALLVQGLFDQANRDIQSIGQIILNRGPGSFTGLRSGMAFAQGLSIGAQVPIYAMTGFEILSNTQHDTATLYLLDTKCNSFYTGYQKQGKWVYGVVLWKDLTDFVKGFSRVVADTTCPLQGGDFCEWQQLCPSARRLAQVFFSVSNQDVYQTEELFYLKEPLT